MFSNREEMKPLLVAIPSLSLPLFLPYFLQDSSVTCAALVLKAEAFSFCTFMFRTWFLCSVAVDSSGEWRTHCRRSYIPWRMAGDRACPHCIPSQDLPAEMFHCLESFNFHFFKTKVSLCPVGISYHRHTLPPSSLSPFLSTVLRLVEFKVLTWLFFVSSLSANQTE